MVNNNDDEIWRINQRFIQEQKNQNKDFYFSHNPEKATGTSFHREVELLRKLILEKYNRPAKFDKIGNYWKLSW